MGDAIHGEGLGDSSDFDDEYDVYIPGIRPPLTREEFEYYHGEDVLSLYHWLQNECGRQGWLLFSSLTYTDMLELAYTTSPKELPK